MDFIILSNKRGEGGERMGERDRYSSQLDLKSFLSKKGEEKKRDYEKQKGVLVK